MHVQSELETNLPIAPAPLRRLKIAQVSATFPPYRGGTGNVCYHNARELARRGHQVQVFTPLLPGLPAAEELDGFSVRRLPPLVRLGNAGLLPGLLKALSGFDLIHFHYPFLGGEFTALAAQLRHIPLVITYHQDVLLKGPRALVEKMLRYSAGRWALRRADRLLFTSLDYARSSYVRPLLRGREERLGELANGVDTGLFCPRPDFDPTFWLNRLGLAADKPMALLVAGLDQAHYFKGVNVFLEALAALLGQVQGVIVGDGDLRPQYEEWARQSGAAVVFAGRVSPADLPDFYRLATVTVLPSLTMGEAFGLVLLESLASGTPVIASDLPGVRTVVAPGSDGLLVKPGDVTGLAAAIGQLTIDQSEAARLGERGRARVMAQYDWTVIGDRLETIYAEVLAERAGGLR